MSKSDITIKDIAKNANVSISTVSRVMNGLDRVSPDTRERVLKVIEEMNFIPNNVAVSMIKKQTKMIAIIVPEIINPFYTAVIHGVEEDAKKSGYFTIVVSTDDREEEERKFFSGVLSKNIDGIISVTACKDMSFYKYFQKPIVLVDRYIENCGFDGVVIDNFGGSYHAVKHIIGKGHKRIALINGPADFNNGRERLWGFEQALRDSCIPVNPEYIKQGDWFEENGYNSMRTLMALKDPPTAVFLANNLICKGAIKAIYDMNLQIGKDISILGFDENELADFTNPKVTTVKRPMIEMGRVAIKILLEKISGQSQFAVPQKITLGTELLIRDSVSNLK